METRKQAVLDALRSFVNQRPGLEFANYGDVSAYRAESRAITKDLHDYGALAGAVAWRDSITADDILKASEHAFSGRLTINDASAHYDDGSTYYVFTISYCAGQYFPTEYRKAACAVLASALWDYQRECMPAPCEHRVLGYHGGVGEQYTGVWKPLHAACAERVERGENSHYIDDRYKLPNGRKGSAGDWMRASFRREFSRSIADRYFN